MKTLLLVLLLAVPAAAQDAFPLASAQIVNAPDVRNWPQTATITRLTFDGSSTRVDFTKKDGPTRWPDVTPEGWKGPLQYTLWLCVQTPQWTCSGFIQFWNTRPASGSPSDPDVPSLYDSNWYYAARWAPIYGHGPIRPGEQIGFLVTSGNARDSVGPYGPQERSNVVVVSASDTADYVFTTPPPVVTPPPVITPPPLGTPPPPVVSPPPPLVVDYSALLREIQGTQQQQLTVEQDTNQKVTEINGQVKTFGQQFGSVMAFVGKYIAPAIAAWITATQVAKP